MEDTWKLQDIIKKRHIISITRVVEKVEKGSEAPMMKRSEESGALQQNAEGVFTDMMDTEKRIVIKKWQPLSDCHCFVTLL